MPTGIQLGNSGILIHESHPSPAHIVDQPVDDVLFIFGKGVLEQCSLEQLPVSASDDVREHDLTVKFFERDLVEIVWKLHFFYGNSLFPRHRGSY